MRIDPITFHILKNFRDINPGLLVRQGNVLSTISPRKDILAVATVCNTFPRNFAISDLKAFLATIELLGRPDFTVQEQYIEIREDENKCFVRFYFCDESMLVAPPRDMRKLKDTIERAEVRFRVSESELNNLLKAASLLGVPHLVVESRGKTINLVVMNATNEASSRFEIAVEDGNGDKFRMVFRTESLKIVKGSYDVAISSEATSYFKHTGLDLEYYISLEQISSYQKAEDFA